MPSLFHSLIQLFRHLISTLEQAFLHFSRPAHYSIALSTAADLSRSKTQLIAENALLRQRLIHGELLKLDIQVTTATIHKYMRLARPRRAPSQT